MIHAASLIQSIISNKYNIFHLDYHLKQEIKIFSIHPPLQEKIVMMKKTKMKKMKKNFKILVKMIRIIKLKTSRLKISSMIFSQLRTLQLAITKNHSITQQPKIHI